MKGISRRHEDVLRVLYMFSYRTAESISARLRGTRIEQDLDWRINKFVHMH